MHIPKHEPGPEVGVFVTIGLLAVCMFAFAIGYFWPVITALFS
ncbi:hypothetical protein [Spirosoma horti]